MAFNAWKTSNYLLNYGAWHDSDYAFRIQPLRPGSEKQKAYLEEFLKRDELSDRARVDCLATHCADLDSFTDLVSRIWPHNEFYTPSLETQRLDLAMVLVSSASDTLGPGSPSPAVFQHLCGSISFAQEGNSTTTYILSHLTIGLGHAAWQTPDVASQWYRAILDAAIRLDKAFLMPEQQPPGTKSFGFEFIKLFRTGNPFANMFLTSMAACPGNNHAPNRARKHKIASRLVNCERAVQTWLDILKECDIDLLEYGRQERQRLKGQQNGYDFRIFRDVWYETPSVSTRNGLFEVRLMGFEYGRQPGDWKLWWSEPTDELVGDFWREMDPEPLRIPGSWDDDF